MLSRVTRCGSGGRDDRVGGGFRKWGESFGLRAGGAMPLFGRSF